MEWSDAMVMPKPSQMIKKRCFSPFPPLHVKVTAKNEISFICRLELSRVQTSKLSDRSRHGSFFFFWLLRLWARTKNHQHQYGKRTPTQQGKYRSSMAIRAFYTVSFASLLQPAMFKASSASSLRGLLTWSKLKFADRFPFSQLSPTFDTKQKKKAIAHSTTPTHQ